MYGAKDLKQSTIFWRKKNKEQKKERKKQVENCKLNAPNDYIRTIINVYSYAKMHEQKIHFNYTD